MSKKQKNKKIQNKIISIIAVLIIAVIVYISPDFAKTKGIDKKAESNVCIYGCTAPVRNLSQYYKQCNKIYKFSRSHKSRYTKRQAKYNIFLCGTS